ncbi:2-oxo-4-hydroxy-4-carboxy-5-ureidoimidazoline decarboxylase [Pseudonocardia hydrocarbonoxydans]|uniref:2-oxo-4-hydroxy-4-carboxy-5-ureidoimidazoline decarboxylase n=1 Tax=Pseudonocardia hydrocarbonoxydans TaxID=76726 RepID=A0A4Y3WTF1_9PSEU|nr:2-oxo-4-hydroxy-4-carboxy-5-ureidoimidazoline decarboxylase [Pseudonocardia hydrocarbonoxydans]GEC21581.1 2-oxo-4-hydroxy-4-carboxy-5-ureidoimidazoline decarboxylase [Pseudonocardia hydrocarbonoxydans]
MRLETFNALPDGDARALLHGCCSSRDWAGAVAAGRPYTDLDALLARAGSEFAALDETQVLDAVHGHPRIGQRLPDDDAHASSRREQAAVADADDAVRAALAEGNAAYEARFGHAFIVCADGRPARELLADLHRRLHHDPATEAGVLRGELAGITTLRLRRMFA